MPKKTLERLTFTFFKTAAAAEDAEELAKMLPILQNRLALCYAEEAFEEARIELSEALGTTPIFQYIQGIQEVAKLASERAAESIDARLGHRLHIEQGGQAYATVFIKK